jgi:predicted permease
MAFPLPLDAYGFSSTVIPEGYVPRSDNEADSAGNSVVAPHYFETMGTRIVAGRPIDERDTASSALVAVINETMAQRYWQTPQRAIGHKFARGQGEKPLEVVGVAKNGVYMTFGESATSYYFTPFTQNYRDRATVIVRSRQNTETLLPALRRQVTALDPSLPIFGVRDMPQFLNRVTSLYDMSASLVGTFAIMAVLLAAVGIYGVLHFTVARRTREIGIRMALGSPRHGVLRLVLQRSLLWVGAGLVVGVGIALAAGGVTERLLAGVSGTDPVTFGAVVLLFGAIALLASLAPARRATRVDPMVALRYE